MHPVVSPVLENAYKHYKLLVPLLFSIFASVANVHEPVQHSLLITAVSWAILWVSSVFKAGIWSNTSKKRRTTSWLAGAFLAFAQICDRAACDKEGTWVAKVNILLCWSIRRLCVNYSLEPLTTPCCPYIRQRAPSQACSIAYPWHSR
jgi:hypothetical protein